MPNFRATTATLGVTALLAAPLSVVLATPAQAAERSARCDGAKFELEVERDDGRFEIDADIDARPGTRWRIVLRQNGRIYTDVLRRADRDGDVELDRARPDTRARDRFTMRVNRVGTSGGCAVGIVTR